MKPTWPTRVTIFSTDIPYPPTRGGRADVWRRIQALARIGATIQLVVFYDDLDGKRPTPEHLAVVRGVVAELYAFPIRKRWIDTLTRLVGLFKTPWHAASRTLRRQELQELLKAVESFRPELIWTEGPWCSLNAEAAARMVQVPLVYRSHNIEHLYMARQAAVAKRIRDKIAWRLACVGLKGFEMSMLGKADWVFDISLDDMSFWTNHGIRNASWLPPVAESALSTGIDRLRQETSKSNDVVFLGNLTTPNNVRGVEWLVNEVRPFVLAKRPLTQFVVAGSNPGPYVKSICDVDGVTLLANVSDALSVYASAKVLVNPVRSGSGMHVKAIEMLMMSSPIVTATQGTSGMPPEVKRLFRVADTAERFADHIVDALEAPADLTEDRDVARALFGVEGLATALNTLGRTLAGSAKRAYK